MATELKFESLAPLGKGQMRCYACKQPCIIKDGRWQDRGSQQVFVCKTCAHKEKFPQR